jgi:hypothetical protein
MKIVLPFAASLCVWLTILGCGDAVRDVSSGTWIAEHDTIGDTVVVRTISGSVGFAEYALERELRIGVIDGPDEYTFGNVSVRDVDRDGNIYAYDSQIPLLRKYDREGRFVATFGREGGGPGEYRGVSGLAVAPDGTLKLWDRRSFRLSSFARDGEFLRAHRIVSNARFGSPPLFVDTLGKTYVGTLLFEGSGFGRTGGRGLLQIGTDGQVVDTLREPDWGYERPTVELTVGSGSSLTRTIQRIPFYPSPLFTFSPHGYYVTGLGDRYAVSLVGVDGRVVRIERRIEPVPVLPEEKSDWRESITMSMRRARSDWRWRGPPIPDTKPAFRQIRVGRDGRIWVLLYQPAERQDIAAPDGQPVNPGRVWVEPVVFDVFEPDGRYLGAVRVPRETNIQVARGDYVWGITRDSLDVQYIERLSLVGSTR